MYLNAYLYIWFLTFATLNWLFLILFSIYVGLCFVSEILKLVYGDNYFYIEQLFNFAVNIYVTKLKYFYLDSINTIYGTNYSLPWKFNFYFYTEEIFNWYCLCFYMTIFFTFYFILLFIITKYVGKNIFFDWLITTRNKFKYLWFSTNFILLITIILKDSYIQKLLYYIQIYPQLKLIIILLIILLILLLIYYLRKYLKR